MQNGHASRLQPTEKDVACELSHCTCVIFARPLWSPFALQPATGVSQKTHLRTQMLFSDSIVTSSFCLMSMLRGGEMFLSAIEPFSEKRAKVTKLSETLPP